MNNDNLKKQLNNSCWAVDQLIVRLAYQTRSSCQINHASTTCQVLQAVGISHFTRWANSGVSGFGMPSVPFIRLEYLTDLSFIVGLRLTCQGAYA